MKPRVPQRPDPFLVGRSEAKAGRPKTGSLQWPGSPQGWYAYSRGYDGQKQAA